MSAARVRHVLRLNGAVAAVTAYEQERDLVRRSGADPAGPAVEDRVAAWEQAVARRLGPATVRRILAPRAWAGAHPWAVVPFRGAHIGLRTLAQLQSFLVHPVAAVRGDVLRYHGRGFDQTIQAVHQPPTTAPHLGELGDAWLRAWLRQEHADEVAGAALAVLPRTVVDVPGALAALEDRLRVPYRLQGSHAIVLAPDPPHRSVPLPELDPEVQLTPLSVLRALGQRTDLGADEIRTLVQVGGPGGWLALAWPVALDPVAVDAVWADAHTDPPLRRFVLQFMARHASVPRARVAARLDELLTRTAPQLLQRQPWEDLVEDPEIVGSLSSRAVAVWLTVLDRAGRLRLWQRRAHAHSPGDTRPPVVPVPRGP